MRSPYKRKQTFKWKKTPSFFQKQEQEEGTEPDKLELELEPETRNKLEEPDDRTSVKARIKLIDKKSSGSPAKVPEWKQAKLAQYFGRKSPKALKARQKNLRQ